MVPIEGRVGAPFRKGASNSRWKKKRASECRRRTAKRSWWEAGEFQRSEDYSLQVRLIRGPKIAEENNLFEERRQKL